MDVDPAGDLPRRLVRWLSEKVPVDALERLKVQTDATRGQYTDFIRRYDPRYDPKSGLTAALPLATEPDA